MATQRIDILLAEDNEDDVVMIKRALEPEQNVPIRHVVWNGEKLLAYLQGLEPTKDASKSNLILLVDINMPKKDGLTAIQEIKRDPKFNHFPIVILTTS